MKLGYLACGHFGSVHHLKNRDRSPRQQLLERCGRTGAKKMYCDHKDTKEAMHIGYIVGGEWYTIYEVHSWEGK